MTSTRSLRQDEARRRAGLLDVTSYDVTLDLDQGDKDFWSRTVIRFTSVGGTTFVDIKPRILDSATLDGKPLDIYALGQGRLSLETTAGEHELVVEATMAYRNDGEGLHRSVDPADGRSYVYGMSFMDAAPSVFACFDQPDLKAPFTFHVRAPKDWTVFGNTRGTQVEPGEWEFETSKPLSTYFTTLVAGPYALVTDEHDGIRLGVSARASIARQLDADADDMLSVTKQSFDELHRLFGIRYQFGDYHQAFVPEFNAGAMENPGCITFRDTLIFTSRVTRSERINRATTIAHEMAHQWFGNLTTPVWWDDLWLNESFAEYLGVRVTADATQYADAWEDHGYARRQWGLVADRAPSTHPVAGNGAEDASTALQNFDGISYMKGSAILRQLATRLGDEAFLGGTVDHFERHFFGNATMADLVASWERASGTDLSDFTEGWLMSAGVDLLDYDRGAGVVRRTPPSGHPSARSHAFRIAVGDRGGWTTNDLEVDAEPQQVSAAADAAVLVDPFADTWAVTHIDDASARMLAVLMPTLQDTALRAGVWTALMSSFHDAALSPQSLVDVAAAALPTETSDAAVTLVRRAVDRLASVAGPAIVDRLHLATRTRAATAAPGSELQLAAFRAAVVTGHDAGVLRGWLGGAELPDGVEIDLDLRWLILGRLAELGATDRDELRSHLDQERTAESHVSHVRAVCSLPDAEAKAWAWQHFTGELDAPNYDLEAAALGLWRPGQEELTQEYAERYFAEVAGTAAVRQGWVLAESAGDFFPITAVSESTLDRARALMADESVDPGIRRMVVDQTDAVERRLRIREKFGSST